MRAAGGGTCWQCLLVPVERAPQTCVSGAQSYPSAAHPWALTVDSYIENGQAVCVCLVQTQREQKCKHAMNLLSGRARPVRNELRMMCGIS